MATVIFQMESVFVMQDGMERLATVNHLHCVTMALEIVPPVSVIARQVTMARSVNVNYARIVQRLSVVNATGNVFVMTRYLEIDAIVFLVRPLVRQMAASVSAMEHAHAQLKKLEVFVNVMPAPRLV